MNRCLRSCLISMVLLSRSAAEPGAWRAISMRRATCASSLRACLTTKGTHRCHKRTACATMINVFRRAAFDCDYFAHDCARDLEFLFAREREFPVTRPILVAFRKDRDQEPY